MMDRQIQTTFRQALSQLRQSPEALPWDQRRQLARTLATALAAGDHSEATDALVEILVGDPKWEVRGDIAGLLHLLPERHFDRAMARLSEDDNGFVRRAAERAMDRRRRVAESAQRNRQEREQLRARLATLERLHGKAVADRARQVAEQMFDELMGALVHEMRGILTPLKGIAFSFLHPGDSDPAVLRRQMLRLSGRLGFLERLLDDMREYSLSPALQRRSERLADLVAEAVAMVRENLKANGKRAGKVRVDVDVPPEISVEVSRDQILLAIANVVKNAFEAYPDGGQKWRAGRIRLSAQVVDDEWLELVVQDEGQGMLAEDLEDIRLFQPGKTTKKGWGTGFGLPLAYRYIAAHGGRMGIDSVENQGTTVTIVLPLESQTGEQVCPTKRW